ncbi:hypothetical protein L218DRAFT_982691 [Marasmius fiardii PR-910]|nr:hypothetical protein L218DRAFT_982691 [Marasmius fiardii PR-910]
MLNFLNPIKVVVLYALRKAKIYNAVVAVEQYLTARLKFCFNSLTCMAENALNYKGTIFGEKAPKGKGKRGKRTRGEIINDLSQCANQHNGDTFTVVCWQAMDLTKNISKARTHFLALALKRNLESSDPSHPDPEIGQSINPMSLLERDRQQRIRDGYLGSVLVVSVELAENELDKTPEQAVIETACPTFQPLGLIQVHQRSFQRLPSLPKAIWKLCLKNALDGYAYAMNVQPRPTPPRGRS